MSLIETEGVEIVPESNRTRGFLQLLVIWAGFNIVITNFLIGSLSRNAGVVTGIVATSISLIAVSAIVYVGTKMAAELGAAGTTAMRAPFGIAGRIIPALAMVLATVGWFGVQTGLVAQSVKTLLANLFGINLPFLLLAAVLGVVMASVAVFGYTSIEWLNRLAVPVMAILLGLVTWQLVTNFSTDIGGGSGEMSFWTALNLFPAAMAAFLIVAMDYGRYGDPDNANGAALGASTATLIPVIVLAGIGVLAASAAGTWNPVQIMVELGLGWVGLLLLVLGSWSTNVTNVYAGGLALSQLTGMKRVYMTILTGLIGTGLAMGGIFSVGGITSFLSSLTITLVPTTGIMIVHYYLMEGGLDTTALFDPEGKYWYIKGWNPVAVVAWVVGAAYAIQAPDWTVPALSSAVIAGIIYFGLDRFAGDMVQDRRPTGQGAD